MNPNAEKTLLRCARENERYAADLRAIAKTDPARYAPAMKAAAAHEDSARRYRLAIRNPERNDHA